MFNLTQDERKVILFLVAVAFIGLGVSFAAKRSGHLKKILTTDADIGKVNLNKVSREDLLRLRLFSPKLGEKIIAYRNEKGPLSTFEELRGIKGINDKRIEELERYFFLR
ncbi:MAG: helix-hairpin-helix domain-containing protein [Candidatus Omnitrophica bacterium]|nr:helix-hairpin-helix domain-containing protein [Candidatus Omnitrophota bacterium]